MTRFDENSSGAIPQNPFGDIASLPARFIEDPSGDPFTYGALHPQPYYFEPDAGPDLSIPWSWGHFLCFILFGFLSLIVIQGAFAAYYVATKQLSPSLPKDQLERFAISHPAFAIGSIVIWYAAIFGFFYFTITAFYHRPFWFTLGWRKLTLHTSQMPKRPWLYFASGAALSVLVMIATASVKPPEHAPIQEMLKDPRMALAFMAMAVLVAPLAEETIFRGYLFPTFQKWFGITPAIALTGVAFGLLHGAQLGWAWAIVTALIVVGVVFTIVRARTGSTFASFLMHLGYNSTIAVLVILAMLAAKFSKLNLPQP